MNEKVSDERRELARRARDEILRFVFKDDEERAKLYRPGIGATLERMLRAAHPSPAGPRDETAWLVELRGVSSRPASPSTPATTDENEGGRVG